MARNPWKKLRSNIELSILARSANRDTGFRRAGNANRELLETMEIISWKELKAKFEEQGRKCYWFGIELNPQDIFNPIPRYPLAISADRLENDGPYSKENIVITCRLANFGRGRVSADEFKKIIDKLHLPNKELLHNKFFEF